MPIPDSTDLLECQTYPNIYPRHYWGTPEVYADAHRTGDDALVEYCDPVGGLAYRTIVYGLDAIMEDIVYWDAIIGPESEAYMVCDENGPMEVELYCSTCDVYFLGTHYDALAFETDTNGYDYMFYGTPNWYVEEKLKVGESKTYGDFTLTINDLNIYENKIYLSIETPDGEVNEYISVINSYTSNVPSNGDMDYTYGTSAANEENDTLAFTASTFDVYALCGGETVGEISLQDEEVIFAVKFIKSFIGAAGNYVVEYHAYELEDYGVLREQVLNGPCETDEDLIVDPAITTKSGYEWYFDIFPADEIDLIDLDNDVDLWEEGNANFDAADAVTIYDPATQAALCVPMLELWLNTPVEQADQCGGTITVDLEDCDQNNYFTLSVTDSDPSDYLIDGAIKITRTTALDPTVTKVYVNLDPEALVKLDESITPAMKTSYNLILIGGPVANSLVMELVDLGVTEYAFWETATDGACVLIDSDDAWGRDVLIVAGADRDATAAAALALVQAL